MKKYLVLLAVGLFLVSASAFSQMTFSGYMFGDYYYNVARDSSFNHKAPANSALSSAAPGPVAMQAFQFRRIYFTMDDNISDVFAARLRLEADQAADPGVTSPNTATPPVSEDALASGKMAPFIKEAWLTWKNVFAGSNLTFGYSVDTRICDFRSELGVPIPREDHHGSEGARWGCRSRNLPQREIDFRRGV